MHNRSLQALFTLTRSRFNRSYVHTTNLLSSTKQSRTFSHLSQYRRTGLAREVTESRTPQEFEPSSSQREFELLPEFFHLGYISPIMDSELEPQTNTTLPERTVSAWARFLIRNDAARMMSPPTQEGQRRKILWYLQRLGVDTTFEQLPPIIHVAGTKGKGSTCAFAESILRKSGFRTGLFTSPHLVDIRERFRIDGTPVPMEEFLQVFWSTIDGLCNTCNAPNPDNIQLWPGYFALMMLLAIQLFPKTKVDVMILEVGIGGKLDVTNVPTANVSGITQLDLDHTEILGDTIDLIAAEKAGILKKGIPGFTVEQESIAMDTIRKAAETVHTNVQLVKNLPLIQPSESSKVPNTIQTEDLPAGPWINSSYRLGLAGDFQRSNAAMAITLVDSLLANSPQLRNLHPESPLSQALNNNEPIGVEEMLKIPAVLNGLQDCRWAGRAQTLVKSGCGPHGGDVVYFLDGAHSPKSVSCCMDWFLSSSKLRSEESGRPVERKLIFNCSHNRNASAFLKEIADKCSTFNDAIFTVGASKPMHVREPNVVEELKRIGLDVPSPDSALGARIAESERSESNATGSWQEKQGLIWDAIISSLGNANFEGSKTFPSIPGAVEYIHGNTKEEDGDPRDVHVLVTGSLLLVGSVLDTIGWSPATDGVLKV